jgi:uncharacterized OB-fold protein
MSPRPRPQPVMDDPDTGGHFQAARGGQVAVRVCDDCDGLIHLPRAVCSLCGGWRTSWVTVRPKGRLHTYSTVHRQVHPAFPAPYTIVLVELADRPGARLVGSVAGAPDLRVGQPMRGRFVIDGEAAFVSWEPDPEAEDASAGLR